MSAGFARLISRFAAPAMHMHTYGTVSDVPTCTVSLNTKYAVAAPILKDRLAQIGPVKTLHVHSSNYSFVEFHELQDAQNCMRRRDGFNLYYRNRTVRITPRDYLEPDPVEPVQRHKSREKSTVLRVDRVPTRAGATTHELLDLLKPYGVNLVRMKVHSQQKRMYLRNPAHAEFATQRGADRAYQASWTGEGLCLRGSRIYVNYLLTQDTGQRNYSQWVTTFA